MSTIKTQLVLLARHHPRRPYRHARLLKELVPDDKMLTSAEQLQLQLAEMKSIFFAPGSE